MSEEPGCEVFGSPSLQALLYTLGMEDDLFLHQSKQQPSAFFWATGCSGEVSLSERCFCMEGRHSENYLVASWCGLLRRKGRFSLPTTF